MKTILHTLLILAWVTARGLAADPIELKQRWIAGKQYSINLQMNQTSTFEIASQKMEQATTLTMETSLAVRPHEDGKRKRVTMKYDRMAIDVSANGQRLGFDSAKPKDGSDPLDLGKMFGPIIGKELRVLTNERDQLVELENYEEFMKELDALGSPAGMPLASMFSREQMLETMKQGSLQAFPEKPVSAGDSWPFSNKITLPGVGSVVVKGTYTYKGMVEHGGVSCAEIVTDGTVALELKPEGEAGAAAGLNAMLPKITEGTLKGPVWFDPQLGMVRDTDIVQSMTMSMKNPLSPEANVVIPLKQSIRATLTKVEDLK